MRTAARSSTSSITRASNPGNRKAVRVIDRRRPSLTVGAWRSLAGAESAPPPTPLRHRADGSVRDGRGGQVGQRPGAAADRTGCPWAVRSPWTTRGWWRTPSVRDRGAGGFGSLTTWFALRGALEERSFGWRT
ncbi:hypothetical protein GCM10010273_17420 [Streptomyces lavendulocolor]